MKSMPIFAGLLWAVSPPALADLTANDRIAPELHSELDATPENELLSSVIFFSERVPIPLLAARLRRRGLNRSARARRVGEALRREADQTQRSIRHALDDWCGPGEVEDYRSLWIGNAMAVTATPAAVRALAGRPEIASVLPDIPAELVRPVASSSLSSRSTGGIEYGLEQIGAPFLWSLGITGEGSVVCNLDTGVRYEHPAIASRWRANQPGVDPSEAWFDALGGRPLPYDNDILSPTHGSHTMGTMTGLDEANADTIGVAFGASWIAAKVFNKYGMGNLTWLIKAFQWAVDPDDNPLTVDDVPTVISNSWGFTSPPCDDALWSVMDACEAMGAAIVFAVGNESALGPRTPQDRITTDVNVFSTGATDANENIASFSSLGPSKCDNITIKPEVSAPGVDVRSIRRTGYGTMSGTSMACPHVAGALALLRQVDPDASVDQIKTALYLSARDKGAPGEDNTFGMGIIDLPAAALLLGETPSVEIEVTGPSEVVAGVPVDVTTIVTNLLAQANTLELWATLTGAIGDYSHPLAHWTVTLAPNSTIETTTEATAPLDLPGGDYVLEVKAGSFPFARSSGGAEFTLSH